MPGRRFWMELWTGVATSLCLVGTAGAAADAVADDFARTGLSIRAGAAIGFEQSEQLEEINTLLPVVVRASLPGGLPAGTTVSEASLDVGPLLGFSLGAGYRLHPRFAVEGSFDWVEGDVSFDLTLLVPALGSQNTRVTLGTGTFWSVTGDFKGYLLTGRIQPYAVVGLGAMRQSLALDNIGFRSEQTSFVPRFGGGIDVYLTRSIALNLDAGYLLGTGDLDGEDFVSLRLGIGGRF